MILTLIFSTIIIILSSIILIVSASLAMWSFQDREKSSPFECGFDPKKSARIPFSLRFFLLMILFLVFDIEIVLILPLPLMIKSGLASISLISAFIFFTILILGLLHEWNEGSLEWTKWKW